MEVPSYKRNVAYKFRIGDLATGNVIFEGERFKCLDFGDKQVVRVNIIANVVDKYIQEGEKKFGSVTLDDGSGQIKIKSFGDDVEKFFASLGQGDTIAVVGLLRSWNNEVYVTPEIIKKKDPLYLLVRKYEIEATLPKSADPGTLRVLREKIIDLVKEGEKDGGVDIEALILNLHESPQTINVEIKKLLEDGLAYEPRPGRLRWLG